jgi:LPXTG-motif cell wall-anchored protein
MVLLGIRPVRSRPIAALAAALTALALAAAPAAPAQNAGEEQYQDPFENEAPENGGGSQEDSGQAPAPSTPVVPQVEPGDGSAEATTAQLPVTGAPAALLAGAGAVLLAGGAVLRRRS